MKKYTEDIYQYSVVFNPNGSGYTVTVPKLPGLVTEGDNLKEAREMAKDAIRCYLESLLKDRMLESQKSNLFRKERLKVAV
ncbi:MAG: type II toxin-antitoxin system HicB family antitoxin [Patescibacteria group bacterium]